MPRDRHLLDETGLEGMSENRDDPAQGAVHPVWAERLVGVGWGGQKDLTEEVTEWGLER